MKVWQLTRYNLLTSPKLHNSYSLYTVGCELLLMNKTHSFSFFSQSNLRHNRFYVSTFCYPEQFENGAKTSVQALVSASVGYTRWIFPYEQAGTNRLFTLTASLLPTFNANRRQDFCGGEGYAMPLWSWKFCFKLKSTMKLIHYNKISSNIEKN